MLLLFFAVAFCSASALPYRVVPPKPPASLPAHPRLVLTHERIATVQAMAAVNGSDAAAFLQMLTQHAEWAITQPPVAHGTPGASGILINVRMSMDLLLTSAAAYVLLPPSNATSAYLKRAIEELLNLCVTWPDWNTVHHALDTGEALLATSLAYDWLYAALSEQQRAQVMDGIFSKGLEPYKTYIPDRKIFWWVNNSINWNCVCSGGGIAATLATYGDTGAGAWAWESVLQPLVDGVVPCVSAYHHDGSWEEGPGYWGYASKYNVWMLAALQSALQDGTACGLMNISGLENAAHFPIYSSGATSLGPLSGLSELHNWADAGSGAEWAPFAGWWGSSQGFNDKAASFWARLGTHSIGPGMTARAGAWAGFVEALAFYESNGSTQDILSLPTHKLYDYINLGIFRSAWDAPAAAQTFLSFKGGNSSWNHNHLDLGSFVYDFAGQRLAEDMGSDSYALPGYFGPLRWTYYRLNSRGHNVLLFGNESQAVTHADIVAFNFSSAVSTPPPAGSKSTAAAVSVDGFAIVDLTAAYATSGGVSSARRGFISISGTTTIIIVDEIVYSGKGKAPANVTWQLHTRATVTLPSASPLEVILTKANSQSAEVQAAFSPSAPIEIPILQASSSAAPVQATLALVKSSTVCPSFIEFHSIDVSKLLPDPPFDSSKGFTRVDAFITNPSAPNAPCTNLTFALGDPAIVGLFTAGTVQVNPMQLWESDGPIKP